MYIKKQISSNWIWVGNYIVHGDHLLKKKKKLNKGLNQKSQEIPYPKSMIPSNYPDAEYMLFIVQKFQSFCTCSGGKARLNINFSKTPNLKVPLHNAPADKRLVFLRLIESPH